MRHERATGPYSPEIAFPGRGDALDGTRQIWPQIRNLPHYEPIRIRIEGPP